MTREIKFRAYDKVSNVMHPGFTIHQIGEIMSNNEPVGFNAFAYKITFKELIFNQYTGLKDKNGVEIYEGDVIQNVADNGTRLSKFEIVWDDMSCSFVKRRCCDGIIFHLEPSKFYERIGNIHQNPELLNP